MNIYVNFTYILDGAGTSLGTSTSSLLGGQSPSRTTPTTTRCASPALAPLPLIFSYTSEKSLCDTGRPRVAVEVLPRWCAPLDAELWLLRSGSFCLWQASLRCGSLLTAARCAVVPPPLHPLAISRALARSAPAAEVAAKRPAELDNDADGFFEWDEQVGIGPCSEDGTYRSVTWRSINRW